MSSGSRRARFILDKFSHKSKQPSESQDHDSSDIDSPMPVLEPLDVSVQPIKSVISSKISTASDSISTNNTNSISTLTEFTSDPKESGKLY